MPGNVYANIRRPLIFTKNFSNIIPLSSAWQGMLYNDFTEETCGSAVPLCTCSTSYGTPFFLNLNVRDVGHTFVFCPTGAGKSTLLALLMASATKYKDANIICIDKQLSSRAFMVGGGGIYVEPGKDAVAFQPLSELKGPDEGTEAEYTESLMWCQQFIEGLLSQQNIETTPEMSKVISETLRLISLKEKSRRTLTTFQQYATYADPENGTNTIRIVLDPYYTGGQSGSIFDADETNLPLSKLVTIEMGSLMRLSEKAVAPALKDDTMKKTFFSHLVHNARDLNSSGSCNRLPRIRFFRLAYGHRPVISAVRHGYEHHYSNRKSVSADSAGSRKS